MSRPSWSEWALGIARAASERSEDPWHRVGACILAHDNSVIGTGYNGAPSGIDIDWTDRDARRPYVIHAEANALRLTKPGRGRLLAVTHLPCIECLKTTKSYGIDEIVYASSIEGSVYDSAQTQRMAFEFGMILRAI